MELLQLLETESLKIKITKEFQAWRKEANDFLFWVVIEDSVEV